MTMTHASPELSRVTEERADLERLVKGPNAYRTISEVADELHVPQHVLRFWETRFPEVKPLKRGGGRRYYSPEDVDLLRHITDLLYVQGYTIKGVQRVLKEALPGSGVTVPPAPPEREIVHPVLAGNGAEIHEAEPVVEALPAGQNDVSPAADTRSSFEIPEFNASAEQDEVVLPSGGGDIEPVTDPGEETVATAVTEPSDETPAELHEVASGEEAPMASSESVIAAVLYDELLELRIRQDRWKQEKRALRLALEDVLGELDNLRQLVPEQN